MVSLKKRFPICFTRYYGREDQPEIIQTLNHEVFFKQLYQCNGSILYCNWKARKEMFLIKHCFLLPHQKLLKLLTASWELKARKALFEQGMYWYWYARACITVNSSKCSPGWRCWEGEWPPPVLKHLQLKSPVFGGIQCDYQGNHGHQGQHGRRVAPTC